jgi:hypothetical protein
MNAEIEFRKCGGLSDIDRIHERGNVGYLIFKTF